MLIIPLDFRIHPAKLLRALQITTARYGLASPAGLMGQWANSTAIIAPSITILPLQEQDLSTIYSQGEGPAIGGGWFGYISYPDHVISAKKNNLPQLAGGWTNSVLRCDQDHRWWWESLTDETLPTWVEQAFRLSTVPNKFQCSWQSPSRKEHQHNIEQCLEAIRAGEIYQACICTQFHGLFQGNSLEFFIHILDQHKPDKAAWMTGPWGAIASFSPELFLSHHGTKLSSSPIKGTLPLTQNPELLRSSIKDTAENIMIVDLVRNDLSQLAHTGSVHVEELLQVRPAPGVWHLISTVSAQCPTTLSLNTMLDAMFPPASVTGTPKLRARKLISEWEYHSRGLYCGAIGFVSPIAGTELNVAIRTVEFDNCGHITLGVGGGITIDSHPDREWQECLDKAASIIGITSN